MAVIGWTGLVAFVVIYVAEFLPRQGPPATIRWIRENLGQGGLITINILIVVSFIALLPYRRPTKNLWRSRGTFIAFVIALMTEMFGWPLLVFLLSPLVSVPRLAPSFFDAVGHWPALVGTALSFAGLALIALGWSRIHRARGLVTGGIYRHIRHPQYTGILLFSFGWILHYPQVITLLLWPILVIAYSWLARREERDALEEFGSAYTAYAEKTKRFIPLVV